MTMTKHLGLVIFALFLGARWSGAQMPAGATPGQVAVAYYQICGQVPLNTAALNALRSRQALEADRKLSQSTLQARAGVLTAVGGHGSLLAVRVLSSQVVGDRATVSVILNYQKLRPNTLEIALVKEDGVWKVAD